MKATRTLANRACLFGIGLLLLLVPHAAQAACFFVGSPADGRILGPYFLHNATDDISLAFGVQAGRSYSAEVLTSRGPSGGGLQSFDININDGSFCPTTDIASGVTIRDTTFIVPRAVGGARKSLVVTTLPVNSALSMRVHNTAAAGSSVVVSFTETTLFSPGWSTMGGAQTFWSFLNNTNATLNGTITLLDTNGTQVAALGVGILTNRAVFPSTITMGIAAGQAGTARFIHDGPPGAVQAEGAITNFTTFFQRVSFAPRVR